MVNATKEQKGDTMVITLAGTIDEADDLSSILGKPTGPTVILCKQVTRINSVGVKNWMKYFGGLQASKVPLRFEELSVALVEQLNVVQNFNCGGEVMSIVVPFKCGGCQTALNGVMKSADLKKIGFKVPPIKCPKCQGQATFDDVAEEFFSFLQR